MRRLALSLLATTSLIAVTQNAMAADLGPAIRKAAPPAAVMPAYYNWSGCYIGGHVGYGWGRKDAPAGTIVDDVLLIDAAFGAFRNDVDGFLGGVQAGCNYQVSPRWVIGFEGQFSWTDMDGAFRRDDFLSGKVDGLTIVGSRLGFSTQVDWVATLAGRIGYTWDRWMLYGKGGVAWARDKHSAVGFIDTTDGEGVITSDFSVRARETRIGWMAGVGFEYAFGINWSAKLEYNYMDFGSDRIVLKGLFDTTEPFSITADIDQQIHVVKFGLNYRWSPAPQVAPVAARY